MFKIADRRRLHVRARAVTHLHELRKRFEDREQAELDRGVLDHAEKMLCNTMKKLGLQIPQYRNDPLILNARAAEIIVALDKDGTIPERLMDGSAS